jgi:hypothetical protein
VAIDHSNGAKIALALLLRVIFSKITRAGFIEARSNFFLLFSITTVDEDCGLRLWTKIVD